MKKLFETPDLTVLKFTVEDIVTISGGIEGDPDETTGSDIRLPGIGFGS